MRRATANANSSTRKKARDMYTKVNYPSIRDFIVMIKKNMINNYPVTIEDVMRAKGLRVQAFRR